MKIKHIKNFDEVFFTNLRNLEKHYNKHIISDEDGLLKMDNMTIDAYNQLADALSTQEASTLDDTNARYVGYITVEGKSVIYDKKTNLLVVFVDDDINGHEAIALYKQPYKKFIERANTHPRFKYAKDLNN